MHRYMDQIELRVDRRHLLLFFLGGVLWTFVAFFFGMLIAGMHAPTTVGSKADGLRLGERGLLSLGWLDQRAIQYAQLQRKLRAQSVGFSFRTVPRRPVVVAPAKRDRSLGRRRPAVRVPVVGRRQRRRGRRVFWRAHQRLRKTAKSSLDGGRTDRRAQDRRKSVDASGVSVSSRRRRSPQGSQRVAHRPNLRVSGRRPMGLHMPRVQRRRMVRRVQGPRKRPRLLRRVVRHERQDDPPPRPIFARRRVTQAATRRLRAGKRYVLELRFMLASRTATVMRRLRRRGMRASFRVSQGRIGGRFYCLRVGRYRSRSAALRAARQIRQIARKPARIIALP